MPVSHFDQKCPANAGNSSILIGMLFHYCQGGAVGARMWSSFWSQIWLYIYIYHGKCIELCAHVLLQFRSVSSQGYGSAFSALNLFSWTCGLNLATSFWHNTCFCCAINRCRCPMCKSHHALYELVPSHFGRVTLTPLSQWRHQLPRRFRHLGGHQRGVRGSPLRMFQPFHSGRH